MLPKFTALQFTSDEILKEEEVIFYYWTYKKDDNKFLYSLNDIINLSGFQRNEITNIISNKSQLHYISCCKSCKKNSYFSVMNRKNLIDLKRKKTKYNIGFVCKVCEEEILNRKRLEELERNKEKTSKAILVIENLKPGDLDDFEKEVLATIVMSDQVNWYSYMRFRPEHSTRNYNEAITKLIEMNMIWYGKNIDNWNEEIYYPEAPMVKLINSFELEIFPNSDIDEEYEILSISLKSLKRSNELYKYKIKVDEDLLLKKDKIYMISDTYIDQNSIMIIPKRYNHEKIVHRQFVHYLDRTSDIIEASVKDNLESINTLKT